MITEECISIEGRSSWIQFALQALDRSCVIVDHCALTENAGPAHQFSLLGSHSGRDVVSACPPSLPSRQTRVLH